MCGRYTLTSTDLAAVAAELDAVLDDAAARLHRPRFNVAPTNAAVIARPGTDRPLLIPAAWGLRRDQRLIINVRSENAAARFPAAYQHGRCVVPADGFYEWTGERSDRRPIWFHPEGGSQTLWMAGLFEERAARSPAEGGAEPEALPVFAVLTTAARPPVAAIHDRMPVLLSREGARRWLLGKPPRVLVPDEIPLAARAVSPRVNATVHDDPACLEPATETGGKQLGLF